MTLGVWKEIYGSWVCILKFLIWGDGWGKNIMSVKHFHEIYSLTHLGLGRYTGMEQAHYARGANLCLWAQRTKLTLKAVK